MRASMVLLLAVASCAVGVLPPQRDAHGDITCTRASLDPEREVLFGLLLAMGGAAVTGYGLYSVGKDAGDGTAWAATALGGTLTTGGIAMLFAAPRSQQAIEDCEKLATQQAMAEKELDDLARDAVDAAHRGDCERAEHRDRQLVARGQPGWIESYRDDPQVVACIPRASGTSAAP